MPNTRRGARRGSQNTETPRRSASRSDIYSGEAAREVSEKAVAESKRRQEEAGKMPFRFYLKQGDEKSFIILDEEPTFLRLEHEEWDERHKRMNYYGCISATDNCPACDALDHPSYLAMYLTIIDLTPFTTKNGDEIEFSKKLLVVKQSQHKTFWRRLDKSGSLRGTLFEAFKDKKTDPRIGNLEYIETLSEDDLQGYIREYEDHDGKQQVDDVEPYDYLELFPETTRESLEQVFGAAPAPGSTRQIQHELKDEFEDDEDEDETPFDGGRPARNRPTRGATERPARSAPRRRR